MKIAVISKAFPEDLQTSVSGLYKRMNMFIQAIKQVGELDVLFYVRPGLPLTPDFLANTEEQLSRNWDAKLKLTLCNMAPEKSPGSFWGGYISPALSITNHPPYDSTSQLQQISAVRKILFHKPDIVFVHRLACMVPILASKEYHPRILFDLDDLEHVAFARSIAQPPLWRGKRLYYLRLPLLGLWERRAIQLSHTTFVCSEYDRDYISRAFRLRNIAVIPNAIEIPTKKEARGRPNILFLGAFSYQPNKVAADYLIRDIWPKVLACVPDARLIIAGGEPERISSFSDKPLGVEFRGFVEDLEALYEEVAVVCCPVLSGGGTRIKIVEAASYGKPIVSTTIGSEGLEFRDGVEIFLRDDPMSFANTCADLLQNRRLATTVGEAARAIAVQKYDMKTIIRRVSAYVRRVSTHCDAGSREVDLAGID